MVKRATSSPLLRRMLARAMVPLAMDKAPPATPAALAQGAGIAYVEPSGRALFLKRSSAGDHPGEWCFPGGHVEEGETAEDAALRESREEIGAQPYGERQPMARTQLGGMDFRTFRQPIAHAFTPRLNREHTEHAWAPLDQPPEPLHPGVRAAIDCAMAMDGWLGADEWNESAHPRASNGEFGSGSGSAPAHAPAPAPAAGGAEQQIAGLFAHSLGMQRKDMPQVPKGVKEQFLNELRAKATLKHEQVDARSLKPTQRDYKADQILDFAKAGVDPNKGTIMVSSDGYVLDGHHRWAAAALNGTKISAIKVGMPIRELLAAAEDFNRRAGVQKRQADPVAADAAWIEADHPRADNGQFGSGGGAAATHPSRSAAPDVHPLPPTRQAAAQAPGAQAYMTPELYNEAKRLISLYSKEEVAAPLTPAEKAKAQADLVNHLAAAHADKPAYDATMKKLGQELGCEVLLAPVKGGERLLEKHVRDNGGNPAEMKDLVRGSLIVDTLDDVGPALEAIGRNFKVARTKDRFAKPTDAGYSDILINVELPGGILGEIQVHIPEMLATKNDVGHGLFEVSRKLPAGSPLKAQLEELQTRVYGSARQVANQRVAEKRESKRLTPVVSQDANSSGLSASPSAKALAALGYGRDSGEPDFSNAMHEPSGSRTTGMPSTSRNLAPSGISESRISHLSAPIVGLWDRIEAALGRRASTALLMHGALAFDAWAEADHPRTSNGQFGNGASFGKLYHGTSLPFEKFEPSAERTRLGGGENHQGQGVYLTDDPHGYGRYFARAAASKRSFLDRSLSPEERDRLDDSDGTMMHVTLSPDANILDMRRDGIEPELLQKFKRAKRSKEDAQAFRDAVLQAGYHGAAFHEPTDLEGWETKPNASTVVVFDPTKATVEKHEPAENFDPRRAKQAQDASTWNEGDHPRAGNGRFGSGGGSSKGSGGKAEKAHPLADSQKQLEAKKQRLADHEANGEKSMAFVYRNHLIPQHEARHERMAEVFKHFDKHGDGAELSDTDGRRHAVLLPDASNPGKYRYQTFDANGFSSHSTHDSPEEAIADAVASGFHVPAEGVLERLAGTPEWDHGMALSALIQAHNEGLADWKTTTERMGELQAKEDARRAGLGQDEGERWITVHGGEGKGNPVLISAGGVVIGGAGGSLNGKTLNPSSSGQAKGGDKHAKPRKLEDIAKALQNRNRNSAASISQMNKIAANPNPRLLMAAPTMADGAPVVTDLEGRGIAKLTGHQDWLVTGKREIPVRYAVVEADQLAASNHAHGGKNEAYGRDFDKLQAINNGRTAGVVEAYARGTADNYKAALAKGERVHGIPGKAIKAMKNPVLVRLMDSRDVDEHIGDESNSSMTLSLSAVEQAGNDAERFDPTGITYNDDGSPSDQSVRAFIAAMPASEQQSLAPNGRPTRQAIERMQAATFHAAYGDSELVNLMAQATDSESRNLIGGMSRAAGSMAKLKEAGELDIRELVTGAAKQIINAVRSGVSVKKFLKQGDLLTDTAEDQIARLMAENIRSAKGIGERLAAAADFAYSESQRGGVDMFGEQIPTASRHDVLEHLNHAEPDRQIALA